jgi:tetratricopeptide (TPR) repeat protein
MNHPNKTFILAIETFHGSPRNFNKFLDDKRLSYSEKSLLKALLNIKANEYKSVIDEINRLTVFHSDLVLGFSEIVLGIAHNNLGDFKQAMQCFKTAIPLIDTEENKACSFMLYYNYFVTCSNISDLQGMKTCVSFFNSHRLQIKRQEIAKNICLFFYYSFTQQYKECVNLIKNIEANRKAISDATWNTYLINKFNFYIQREDYLSCRKVLSELKQIRIFKCIENYKFMLLMLNHIEKNDPIYAYSQDFKDVPILLNQIMLIKSLESGEIELAQQYWYNLREINPRQYDKLFEYSGPKCLFSLALEKHQKSMHSPKLPELNILNITNKVDQLFQILQIAKQPIYVGELFENIYQQEFKQEKENARKIQVLISKVKQKHSVEITFQRNHYQLIQSKAKAKAKKSA